MKDENNNGATVPSPKVELLFLLRVILWRSLGGLVSVASWRLHRGNRSKLVYASLYSSQI